ncbi:MAG TPA: NUDIX hydrolase [Chryseosolibacter sp.]
MKTRQDLSLSLEAYTSAFPEEQEFVARFLQLLKNPRAYHRDHLPGHMTGSAWIIDQSRQYTLLVHHAKLQRWLQPGGHADGDENIVAVARKEAEEETGLQKLTLLNPIFDIDIHPIPARKDFPQHDHYDIRCLFMADKNELLVVSEESHAVEWIPLKDVATRSDGNDSINRMVKKIGMAFSYSHGQQR